MHAHSLRLKLALTYAGMALLTALILGGILLAVLGNYYSRAEEDYLRASAELIANEPLPLHQPGCAHRVGAECGVHHGYPGARVRRQRRLGGRLRLADRSRRRRPAAPRRR